MNATRPGTPTWATRTLGVLGVAGGLALLLAYLLEIPPAWNALRLVLFCAGAIALALATHGRHAAVSRRLALAGTIPLVIANALYIGWILLSLGQERPFAGDFGLVGFWAALAFWLADAWFGVIALRLGVVWRGAALILVAGSLMSIAGMDRLELTSQANPTVFGPLALTGVALNGLAWVLLGLPIAFPRIRSLPGGSPVPADGPA
jgi:Na+-translocating ferredoxin:NAD+ oxidoreductase RnfA subunit